MHRRVGIEDIQAMRREQGIEDVDLGRAVAGLRVGDIVKLTLLAGANAATGETLRVRITRICGPALRGKLVSGAASAALAHLKAGTALAFDSAHIHSVPKGPPAPPLRSPARSGTRP